MNFHKYFCIGIIPVIQFLLHTAYNSCIHVNVPPYVHPSHYYIYNILRKLLLSCFPHFSCRETMKKKQSNFHWNQWCNYHQLKSGELHLCEMFRVRHQFCATAKNWVSLPEHSAQRLVTELILFFLANGDPQKLAGNTFSLEGWIEKIMVTWLKIITNKPTPAITCTTALLIAYPTAMISLIRDSASSQNCWGLQIIKQLVQQK